MTTVASLDPATITIPHGGQGSSVLTVHNRGDIVEGYQFEVLGAAAEWASIDPPDLRVYPGNEGTVTISFRMPEQARTAVDRVPFAVRVLPAERPEEAVVPEGTLVVGALTELNGELLPENSRTRRVATHEIAVDNTGNTAVLVQVEPVDPDGALQFRARPVEVLIPPGGAAIAELRLRHRKLQWRGVATPRRFQVRLASPDAPEVVLAGTSVQQPILGSWLWKAAAALLILALIAAGLWFGLVKPAVSQAAKQAAAAEASKQADGGGAGGGNEAPGGGSSGGPEAPDTTETTPGPALTTSPSPVGPGGAGQIADFADSIEIADSAGGTIATKNFPRPGGATTPYTISYVLLSAPQGDNGLLELVVGTKVLVRYPLINYRVYDHAPRPAFHIPANAALTLKLNCVAVGTEAGAATQCKALVTFSGVYTPKATA